MSVSLMAKCWPLSMSSTQKLVLIALADYADDDGVCWPSIAGLADKTNLTSRAVISAVQALEKIGVLSKKKSLGRNTQYVVSLDGLVNVVHIPVNVVHGSTSERGSHTSERGSHGLVNVVHIPVNVVHQPMNVVHTNHHKPSLTIKKQSSINTTRAVVDRPDDVSEKTWADFLTHRKAKKSPMTDTALVGIRREADKASWSLSDALAEMCQRGWIGFKAEWVAPKVGGHLSAHGGFDKRNYGQGVMAI